MNSLNPEFQYNMLRVGEATPKMQAPLALPLLQGMNVPKYSGKFFEWTQIQTRWEGYISIYLTVLDEKALFEILRHSLDTPSVNSLDLRLTQDPDLTYQQFWAELSEEMNRGAKEAHRNEWRKVKPKLLLSVKS